MICRHLQENMIRLHSEAANMFNYWVKIIQYYKLGGAGINQVLVQGGVGIQL